MRITFPNAEFDSKTVSEGDTLTVTPRMMNGGHPTGHLAAWGGYSVSFEFKVDVDEVNHQALEILFGIKPKRRATKIERAVALAVVASTALTAPIQYGWALARREVSLAASVPSILRGVYR